VGGALQTLGEARPEAIGQEPRQWRWIGQRAAPLSRFPEGRLQGRCEGSGEMEGLRGPSAALTAPRRPWVWESLCCREVVTLRGMEVLEESWKQQDRGENP